MYSFSLPLTEKRAQACREKKRSSCSAKRECGEEVVADERSGHQIGGGGDGCVSGEEGPIRDVEKHMSL